MNYITHSFKQLLKINCDYGGTEPIKIFRINNNNMYIKIKFYIIFINMKKHGIYLWIFECITKKYNKYG